MSREVLAQSDLQSFSEWMGYVNAPFQEGWYCRLQPCDDAEHFSPLREHPHAFKLFHLEAPRKHAKSECVAVNYVSWMVGNYPDIHVTIVSKTATIAEATVAAIKMRMDEDVRYRAVFGDLKPANPQKWTNTELIVRRKIISKFPTLYATGLGGSLTGGGNDLIVADDLIDEEDVITDNAREKASTWFHKVLLTTLFPWGGCLSLGTRWHHADLYGELLEKWPHQVLKAMIDEEKKIVLWPEMWSYDKLVETRNNLGTPIFNCQFQNDPTGLEGGALQAKWLHNYDKLPDSLLHYAGVDPALGAGDKAGISTLAYDGKMRQGYLREVWADKVPLPQLFKELRARHTLYNYAKIFVESNAFQKALINMPELQGLPVVASNTDQNEERRYIAMGSHFESSRILVNPILKAPSHEFNSEWIQFPKGQYTDALAATEIVTRNVIGGSGGSMTAFKFW